MKFSRTSVFRIFRFADFWQSVASFVDSENFDLLGVSDLVKKIVQSQSGILVSIPKIFYMVDFGRWNVDSMKEIVQSKNGILVSLPKFFFMVDFGRWNGDSMMKIVQSKNGISDSV